MKDDIIKNATQSSDKNRRPLKSRGTRWANLLTRLLLKTPITPNQISVIGITCAFAGATAMICATKSPWLWLIGALGIQLRLLCNMMDGLVAVEGQRGSPVGVLYNELPDRVQDVLLLVAAGYASDAGWLGWLAATLAVSTSYIRTVGASFGFAHDYCGPMAKPHRMAALTIGTIGYFGAILSGYTFNVVYWFLVLICLGTVATIVRRVIHIAELLRKLKV